MDTYNRGQWGKDDSYPDQWEINANNQLVYSGYEGLPVEDLSEFRWEFKAYSSNGTGETYEFLVIIGNVNAYWPYLVTDFPSLLMLIKEVLPLIDYSRKEALFDMQKEEHEWKAKDLGPSQYRKNCGHV